MVIRCGIGGGVRAACSRRRIATHRRIAAIAGAVYKRCGCAFWPRERLMQRLRYRKQRTKAIEWRLYRIIRWCFEPAAALLELVQLADCKTLGIALIISTGR